MGVELFSFQMFYDVILTWGSAAGWRNGEQQEQGRLRFWMIYGCFLPALSNSSVATLEEEERQDGERHETPCFCFQDKYTSGRHKISPSGERTDIREQCWEILSSTAQFMGTDSGKHGVVSRMRVKTTPWLLQDCLRLRSVLQRGLFTACLVQITLLRHGEGCKAHGTEGKKSALHPKSMEDLNWFLPTNTSK